MATISDTKGEMVLTKGSNAERIVSNRKTR